MEHPFLSVAQIKEELSVDEIHKKIQEIVGRLNFAHRTGNQQLINQLQMVYETYSRAQMEKVDELFGNDGKGHQGKIDIS